MTARRATSKKTVPASTDPFDGAVEVAPEDLVPQELDPVDPAITRWRALADRDIRIDHDDDAEKVAPFPRPAWADPAFDFVGGSWRSTCYESSPAEIPLSDRHGLATTEGWYMPASLRVVAKLYADGTTRLGLTLRERIDRAWKEWGASLTPDEALELTHVLQAAVELVGDPHAGARNDR